MFLCVGFTVTRLAQEALRCRVGTSKARTVRSSESVATVAAEMVRLKPPELVRVSDKLVLLPT